MSAIRGTYLNGSIVLDTNPDWAEGTLVDVDVASDPEYPDDDDDSPEANAKRIALMEEFERGPVMSDEDAEQFEVFIRDQSKAEKPTWTLPER